MYDDSSEARNSTEEAISYGRAHLPEGKLSGGKNVPGSVPLSCIRVLMRS